MRTVTVANLKGGSGKTTTAAFLLHAYWQMQVEQAVPPPFHVMGVDADPAGSLLRWSEMGGWDVPVVGLPVRNLHARLGAVCGNSQVVVVDTPPLDEQAGVVYSALRAADDVVVPVGPSTMELDRLGPVFAAMEEVSALRARPTRLVVLLTRTVANAVSTHAAREAITDAGYRVLETTVPRLERYAQAFGTVPSLVPGDAYAVVAAEILKAGPDVHAVWDGTRWI